MGRFGEGERLAAETLQSGTARKEARSGMRRNVSYSYMPTTVAQSLELGEAAESGFDDDRRLKI